MNKLLTTLTGGFPLTLNDIGYLQQSTIDSFKGILSAFGVAGNNAVILSGCERSVGGGNVTISAGYVSIGGEVCLFPEQVYPAPGLSVDEYFKVVSTFDPNGNKVFQNGSTNDTYQSRIAQIELAGSVPTGFTKYTDAKSIYQIIDENIDGVPMNAIIMWSGSLATIPSGYVLCDGNNNTPDLRGRFIVGYDDNDSDYSIGNTGGEKKHLLTVSEMPSHQHDVLIGTTSTGDPADFDALIIPSASIGNHEYDPIDVKGGTGSKGSNAPHENRPPYYSLAFIQKTGTTVNSNTPWTAVSSSS